MDTYKPKPIDPSTPHDPDGPIYKDPLDEELWDNEGEYIGPPKEECCEGGDYYKDMEGATEKSPTYQVPTNPHRAITTQPKDHASKVGGAMADKFTPKPKTKPYGGGGSHHGGSGYYGRSGYQDDFYDSHSHRSSTGYYPSHGSQSSSYKPNSNKKMMNDDSILAIVNSFPDDVKRLADVSEEELDLIAEIVAKDLGELFDSCNLVWGSKGGCEFRRLIFAFMNDHVLVNRPPEDGVI